MNDSHVEEIYLRSSGLALGLGFEDSGVGLGFRLDRHRTWYISGFQHTLFCCVLYRFTLRSVLFSDKCGKRLPGQGN